MIRGGFLSADDRRALTRLARDGLAEHRPARRANAIVLLDQVWSCERVAAALLLDDDTVRNWHRAFEGGGIEALKTFDHEGSSRLTEEQLVALADWVDAVCPRSIRKVGAYLKRTFGVLLGEIEGTHTAMRLIHVFVDNASYHHAQVVKEWLATAGRKIVLHFLPPYCPHLDPIERLWALMHENVTHNRDYKTFAEFRREVIGFLRHTVPRGWKHFCDRITGNFRVIHRADFRLLT